MELGGWSDLTKTFELYDQRSILMSYEREGGWYENFLLGLG